MGMPANNKAPGKLSSNGKTSTFVKRGKRSRPSENESLPVAKRASNKSKYNGKEAREKMGKYKPAVPEGSRGQQQKRLKTERQMAGPTGELRVDAIKIWEDLRRGDIESDKRACKMEEIMDVLRGKIKDVVFKRDMSR
ncbi:Pumilio y domain member 6, partial [Coemansia erecta]